MIVERFTWMAKAGRKYWADLVWSPEDDGDVKNLDDNLMESEYTRELIRVH